LVIPVNLRRLTVSTFLIPCSRPSHQWSSTWSLQSYRLILYAFFSSLQLFSYLSEYNFLLFLNIFQPLQFYIRLLI
jgi:hypothetical protein